jgi:CheY-like chemotaxis protein
MRLFLADDIQPVREVVRAALDRLSGCQVVGEAGSGPEALAGILQARPDLVIMDLHMPGLGGLEVVREMRRLGIGTPVIFCSSEPPAERDWPAGIVGHFQKPFRLDRLQHLVAALQTGTEIRD